MRTCVFLCVCVHNSSFAVSLSLSQYIYDDVWVIVSYLHIYSSFVLFLNYVLSYLLPTTTQKQQQQLVWPF